MSALCETCPLRNDCVGGIDNAVSLDLRSRFERKPLWVTRFRDVEGNNSALFYGTAVDLLPEIDSCQRPGEVKVPSGVFSSTTIPACGVKNNSRATPEYFDSHFEYGLKIADGTAVIEDTLEKIETKKLRRYVYLGCTAMVSSGATSVGGMMINNREMAKLGVGAFLISTMSLVFGLYKTVDNYEKQQDTE